MILPPRSRKATDRGSLVFFIHMHQRIVFGNTNSMPASRARLERCISPFCSAAGSSATSAETRECPAARVTVRASAAAPPRQQADRPTERSAQDSRLGETKTPPDPETGEAGDSGAGNVIPQA